LRDLVDNMLATDPDARPSLDDIVRTSKSMRAKLADGKQRGGSKSNDGGGGKESSGGSGRK